MDFPAAIAYLDGFVNFERSVPNHAMREALTLGRVRELAARLGNPQERFPSLHVAGTKGKGSTCAFAAAMLDAAGYKIGLYVSPHLQDVRERISIGGRRIAPEDFARLLLAARPGLEAMRGLPVGERRPTYFEVLTHLAFAWFAEEGIDAAVVEVGLGGRLDATNIVRPAACAITNISFDHMAILGNTLPQIAAEKAGIFKPGVPVVAAPQTPEVLATLEERARQAGARLEMAGRDYTVETLAPAADDAAAWPRAAVTLKDGTRYEATLGLRGAFQVENWAVAVRLADHFALAKTGAHIPAAAVARGARAIQWPGRMEEVEADVVARFSGQAPAPRLILDGAHNDHSLRTILSEIRAACAPSRRLVVLFGCAKDKDAGAMLRVLSAGGVEHVVFTHSGNARGRNPRELAAEWAALGGAPASACEDCAAGLRAALEEAGPQGLAVAAGSLYLVGAIKDLLNA